MRKLLTRIFYSSNIHNRDILNSKPQTADKENEFIYPTSLISVYLTQSYTSFDLLYKMEVNEVILIRLTKHFPFFSLKTINKAPGYFVISDDKHFLLANIFKVYNEREKDETSPQKYETPLNELAII